MLTWQAVVLHILDWIQVKLKYNTPYISLTEFNFLAFYRVFVQVKHTLLCLITGRSLKQ